MIRSFNFAFAALCFAVLVGCHQKEVGENGTLRFSFQTWVPLLVVVAGLAAIPAGVVMFARKQQFWGVCLAVLGPAAAGVVAPGMFLDKVEVNPEGFSSRHGFWWDPIIHNVRYADLNQVKVVVQEQSGRNGKTYSYFFDCQFKTRGVERVPLGDIMREALPEIAEHFRSHGVPVQIPPNLPD